MKFPLSIFSFAGAVTLLFPGVALAHSTTSTEALLSTQSYQFGYKVVSGGYVSFDLYTQKHLFDLVDDQYSYDDDAVEINILRYPDGGVLSGEGKTRRYNASPDFVGKDTLEYETSSPAGEATQHSVYFEVSQETSGNLMDRAVPTEEPKSISVFPGSEQSQNDSTDDSTNSSTDDSTNIGGENYDALAQTGFDASTVLLLSFGLVIFGGILSMVLFRRQNI